MSEPVWRVSGFMASAAAAGLKKNNDPDLALLVSRRPAAAAGVFTTNRVKAAPVLLSQRHIGGGSARAVIVNAGNANACTGEAGLEDASRVAQAVARRMGIPVEEVLVASTGVIGQRLAVDRVVRAIPGLADGLSADGLASAAQAILTTDSFPKLSRVEKSLGDRSYTIQGIAKGAGMIMPDMATMLSFILTDVKIPATDLNRALRSSVDKTFNRIIVDGDTSTNDMVLAMANGAAENPALSKADLADFEQGLRSVMAELARMIVADGEGATKVVHIRVRNGHSGADVLKACRTVGVSSLVKTAFYGQDPNWGRIMAALGRAGIVMEAHRVDIWINDTPIVSGGLGKGAEWERKAAEHMKGSEFTVTIDLHQGSYEDRVTTCDLTHDYVSINADYRS